MKSLKLAVVVSAVMLSLAGVAQADSNDSTNRLNHNFMSKRAYQAPVDNAIETKGDAQWEGATLVPKDDTVNKNSRNPKQVKINSFARRSYVD